MEGHSQRFADKDDLKTTVRYLAALAMRSVLRGNCDSGLRNPGSSVHCKWSLVRQFPAIRDYFSHRNTLAAGIRIQLPAGSAASFPGPERLISGCISDATSRRAMATEIAGHLAGVWQACEVPMLGLMYV